MQAMGQTALKGRNRMIRLAFRGFPRLSALIEPQLRLLPVVLLLGLAAAVLEGFGIGLIIPMLGIILGGSEGDLGGFTARLAAFGSGMSDTSRMIFTGGAIFLLILLKNLFAFGNSLLSGLIYGKSGHAIRCALSDRLLRVGYPFFQTEDPGRLLNIISNESWRTSDAVEALLTIVINACAAITLFIFLLLISWQLTILVTLALMVIQLLHARLSAALKGDSRKVTARNSQLASQMLHLVNANQLIVAEVLQDLTDDPLQLDWQKRRSPWGRRFFWLLLILLGVAGLAGQYVAYHFDELARQDQYRPWFQQLCPHIGCTVPSKVDIAKIKSSNLVVRSHPDFKGALVVDAIIYNRAPFSQPFPLLELRFADLNGHLIASRRFKPGEYLNGDLEGMAEMPPQTPIHIALDILDPGSKAVNYSLSFHSPE